jgi:hypothetical protein
MCRQKTNRSTRLLAACVAAIGVGAGLAGCSDIYLDHRDTVALSGGDAVAANEATQMVDPWPPNSGNNNIAYNGQKMQSAVERYRTNRVIPPINATTSVIEAPPAEGAAAASPTQSAASGAPGTATTTAAAAQ